VPGPRTSCLEWALKGAATILQCAECEQPWMPEDAEHWWSAYLTDEPPRVVFYCPECAEREFGGD
jgi:hypothetical protein